MRAAHRALGCGLLVVAMAALAAPGRGQSAADKVTLQTMSYADLGKLVRSHKGKVIVVDFWADT
jgi:thiol:disulfide interchange protein